MPLHLFIVHFPVTLLVLGAAADLAGALGRSPALRRGAGWLIILGAVSALLAFATGGAALSYLLMTEPGRVAGADVHAQWGSVGLWVAGATGLVRALWRHRLGGPHGLVHLALAVAAGAVAIGATLSGTAIRHHL